MCWLEPGSRSGRYQSGYTLTDALSKTKNLSDSDSWSVKTYSCCQLQVRHGGGEENDIVRPNWQGMFLTFNRVQLYVRGQDLASCGLLRPSPHQTGIEPSGQLYKPVPQRSNKEHPRRLRLRSWWDIILPGQSKTEHIYILSLYIYRWW